MPNPAMRGPFEPRHCLKMCFAILCLFLLDFRAYNHGLKWPRSPKHIVIRSLSRSHLSPLSLLLGRERVATVSCSRKLPRQHIPTTPGLGILGLNLMVLDEKRANFRAISLHVLKCVPSFWSVLKMSLDAPNTLEKAY